MTSRTELDEEIGLPDNARMTGRCIGGSAKLSAGRKKGEEEMEDLTDSLADTTEQGEFEGGKQGEPLSSKSSKRGDRQRSQKSDGKQKNERSDYRRSGEKRKKTRRLEYERAAGERTG